MFEAATGRELLKYLTAHCFGAVEWEVVPGTTYEKAAGGCDAIFHCRTSFYIAVIVISFCSGACAAVSRLGQ